MKYEVTGRVVGHSIFLPNPKDEPDLELVKIALVLSPATTNADKHTRAVIVVEKNDALRDLVLGRILRITLEDSQQDMFLPPTSDRGETKGTVEFMNPKTGEVVETDLATLERAAETLEARAKGRRGSARSRAH